MGSGNKLSPSLHLLLLFHHLLFLFASSFPALFFLRRRRRQKQGGEKGGYGDLIPGAAVGINIALRLCREVALPIRKYSAADFLTLAEKNCSGIF